MDGRVAFKAARGAEPDIMVGCHRLGVKEVLRIDRAHFNRARAGHLGAHGFREEMDRLFAQLAACFQALWPGYIRHFGFVEPALFCDLKRGGEVENLFAMLDGNNAARGEGAAIARMVDLIDDRDVRVAGANEIGMHGMADTVFNRLIGGHHRLSDHLPAENALRGFVRRYAAKQVDFEALHLQQIQYDL